MIALDTSAIVAIALGEPEEDDFSRHHRLARGPGRNADPARSAPRPVRQDRPTLTEFIDRVRSAAVEIHPVAFSLDMYRIAV